MALAGESARSKYPFAGAEAGSDALPFPRVEPVRLGDWNPDCVLGVDAEESIPSSFSLPLIASSVRTFALVIVQAAWCAYKYKL